MSEPDFVDVLLKREAWLKIGLELTKDYKQLARNTGISASNQAFVLGVILRELEGLERKIYGIDDSLIELHDEIVNG